MCSTLLVSPESSCLCRPNSIEPPWYGPVCPVVWEGWRRETSPYPDRYPGIKIHDRRVIRLLEVLLHGGTHVGGWTAKEIHQSVRTTFGLSERSYGLNQLRYDLRKVKGHGLLERDGSRYAYRLTPKGVQIALLFLFFHKRLCGPLANSRLHHRPDPQHRPNSRPFEAAYHRADKAIQNIVDLLAAA